jgi:hypothetical protein
VCLLSLAEKTSDVCETLMLPLEEGAEAFILGMNGNCKLLEFFQSPRGITLSKMARLYPKQKLT